MNHNPLFYCSFAKIPQQPMHLKATILKQGQPFANKHITCIITNGTKVVAEINAYTDPKGSLIIALPPAVGFYNLELTPDDDDFDLCTDTPLITMFQVDEQG